MSYGKRPRGYTGTYYLPARRASTNTYKRARKRSASTTPRSKTRLRIPAAVSAIPDSVTVTLNYVQDFTVNLLASIGPVAYVFGLNDIYDPYTGVGGGQPTGFDQWMNMFNRFRVSSSTIKVQFQNEDAVASPTTVSIVPNPIANSALLTRWNNGDLTYGKQIFVANKMVGTANPRTISSSMSMQKLVGPKWKYDDDYFGTASRGPTAEGKALWYIVFHNHDPTTYGNLKPQGYMKVSLSYKVLFQQRKVVTDA